MEPIAANRTKRCQRHSDSKKHPLKIHWGPRSLPLQTPPSLPPPTEAVAPDHGRSISDGSSRRSSLIGSPLPGKISQNESPVPPLRSSHPVQPSARRATRQHILQLCSKRLSVQLLLNGVMQMNRGSTLLRRRRDVFTVAPSKPVAHFQLESV